MRAAVGALVQMLLCGCGSSGNPCLVAHHYSSIHRAPLINAQRTSEGTVGIFMDKSPHRRAIPTFITRLPLLQMSSHFVQIKEIKPNKWLHE